MAHNYAYFKFFLLITLSTIGVSKSFAEIKNEDDGFSWIEFGEFNAMGAKDIHENIIIDPKLKCSMILYRRAKDENVSIGYFSLTKFEKDNIFEGICDIKGNIIIPIKYDYAGARIKICGSDTLAYFIASNNNLEASDIYDSLGKKIASKLPHFEIDENGYLYNFKTGKPLNIKIPSANGKLSNFYREIPSEKINTQLGTYDIKVMDNESFKWKLLYTANLCGAMNMDNQIIIPVEKKYKNIEFNNGYFFTKTMDGGCAVYSKTGKEIIPISNQISVAHVDAYTKSYFTCTTFDDTLNDKSASLYDLNGNLVISTGKYRDISPRKIGSRIYFIVRTESQEQVLDQKLNVLVSINLPNQFYSIEKDDLGLFYKICNYSLENKHMGILNQYGKMVIAPGHYDLINRIIDNGLSFYETVIIENENYNHGVCDFDGNEIIPAQYSYITTSSVDGKLHLRQGKNEYAYDLKKYNSQKNTEIEQQKNISASITISQKQTLDSKSTPSKYAALSDPNLVDNSSEIIECEQRIRELEQQKKNCYLCHGTGKGEKSCFLCSGTGWGFGYGKYRPICNNCQGRGKVSAQCPNCEQTELSISIQKGLLKTYKETHGMTKETEAFYYGHHEKMRQIERDHQNAINAIADPYLNNSSQSSTTSTRSNCSICSGTGVDPFPWEDGSTGHGQGIYTNQSGKKCPHCGRYTWHQHVRCSKCNAR